MTHSQHCQVRQRLENSFRERGEVVVIQKSARRKVSGDVQNDAKPLSRIVHEDRCTEIPACWLVRRCSSALLGLADPTLSPHRRPTPANCGHVESDKTHNPLTAPAHMGSLSVATARANWCSHCGFFTNTQGWNIASGSVARTLFLCKTIVA